MLHVAAGVIRDNNGKVLLSQRQPGRHQQGKWEFPGGKLESGEIPRKALARELKEELGIQVKDLEPRIQVLHSYPDITVMLEVFDVLEFAGTPDGIEGQNIEWVGIEALDQYEFPAANLAVVSSLNLPSIYAISRAVKLGQENFLLLLEQRLKAGLRLVQLREPGMEEAGYAALAKKMAKIIHRYNGKLLLNTLNIELVKNSGADGLHLSSQQLMSFSHRPLPEKFLVSASCHNEQELRRAEEIGATFAVLSPVKETGSHPEAIAIGWEKFSTLVRICSIPIYALGGMSGAEVHEARQYGAQGVAVLSAAWEEGFLGVLKKF